jgi:hypothetical protein
MQLAAHVQTIGRGMSGDRLDIVAHRSVAKQRPRNKRIWPLLCSRQINNRPFLSNGSVNTFPRKRTRTQQQKNGFFDVVRAKELSWRQLSWPVQLSVQMSSAKGAEKSWRYSWVSWVLHGRLYQQDLSAGSWRISIVRSRCQETSSEDWEDLACTSNL